MQAACIDPHHVSVLGGMSSGSAVVTACPSYQIASPPALQVSRVAQVGAPPPAPAPVVRTRAIVGAFALLLAGVVAVRLWAHWAVSRKPRTEAADLSDNSAPLSAATSPSKGAVSPGRAADRAQQQTMSAAAVRDGPFWVGEQTSTAPAWAQRDGSRGQRNVSPGSTAQAAVPEARAASRAVDRVSPPDATDSQPSPAPANAGASAPHALPGAATQQETATSRDAAPERTSAVLEPSRSNESTGRTRLDVALDAIREERRLAALASAQATASDAEAGSDRAMTQPALGKPAQQPAETSASPSDPSSLPPSQQASLPQSPPQPQPVKQLDIAPPVPKVSHAAFEPVAAPEPTAALAVEESVAADPAAAEEKDTLAGAVDLEEEQPHAADPAHADEEAAFLAAPALAEEEPLTTASPATQSAVADTCSPEQEPIRNLAEVSDDDDRGPAPLSSSSSASEAEGVTEEAQPSPQAGSVSSVPPQRTDLVVEDGAQDSGGEHGTVSEPQSSSASGNGATVHPQDRLPVPLRLVAAGFCIPHPAKVPQRAHAHPAVAQRSALLRLLVTDPAMSTGILRCADHCRTRI